MDRFLRQSLVFAVLSLNACGLSYAPMPSEPDQDPVEETQERVVNGIREIVPPSAMQMQPLELRDNPEVRRFQRRYLGSQRSFISDALKRKQYLPMMRGVFRKQSLPLELTNIAVIESRLLPRARSGSGAVGIWQFMRPTARHYGLKVTLLRDERKDPVKSTYAAARYLSYLYDRFDDWFLAIAAYNAGPARMSRAIKKYGTRDFFELVQKGAFRKETAEFVHKFIAVTMILRDPDRYGFTG